MCVSMCNFAPGRPPPPRPAGVSGFYKVEAQELLKGPADATFRNLRRYLCARGKRGHASSHTHKGCRKGCKPGSEGTHKIEWSLGPVGKAGDHDASYGRYRHLVEYGLRIMDHHGNGPVGAGNSKEPVTLWDI
eukprot:jgi/Botrbrau1/3496/Bobra.341_2s0026.1